MNNDEKLAGAIRESQVSLQPYLLAAIHLATAGESLNLARDAMVARDESDLDGPIGSIDLVLSRLKIVAVDVSLAAEEYDPDDQVGKVFSQSVFA